MILKENIIKEIKKIYDPEIPVNIFDLGLIYDISIKDKIVLIFPDHGSRYISKIYDDQWMIEQGFMKK